MLVLFLLSCIYIFSFALDPILQDLEIRNRVTIELFYNIAYTQRYTWAILRNKTLENVLRKVLAIDKDRNRAFFRNLYSNFIE